VVKGTSREIKEGWAPTAVHRKEKREKSKKGGYEVGCLSEISPRWTSLITKKREKGQNSKTKITLDNAGGKRG